MLAMEEGKSEAVEVDIELTQLTDVNSNVTPKTINEKAVESIAEAIVKDIEYEISERFDSGEIDIAVLASKGSSESLKDNIQKT